MSEIKTPPRRLVDLNPEWMTKDGVGIYGIRFDCPCGAPKRDAPGSHFHGWPVCDGGRVGVHFSHAEGNCWQRTGEDFETLTLSPSLHLEGHWHGWLQNGVLTSC